MKKNLFLTSAIVSWAMVNAVLASPSGLNNIPTADTAPNLVPVIQAYGTFGEGRGPDHTAGMKFGLGPWDKAFLGSRFEVGVDGHYAPDPIGPAVFQVKYAVQPWEKGPAIAVGSANIAASESDRSRAGQPFSYAVLTQDLGYFRLHGGYGLQHNGDAGLLGIDKTFDAWGRPFTLRADAVQIRDQKDWMASVGAMYVVNKWLVLEAWGSFPVDQGDPSITLKLNFVLDWKR